tara:strand:+ start:2211 stop:2717 length:507 start_codon:yes stop_codon:yes gene_type:complete
MDTIIADKILKRSKHDPKVRADKMASKAGRTAAGFVPLALFGNLGNTLLAPLGYRGRKTEAVAKDKTSPWQGTAQKMQNVYKNSRGAKEIRGAFGMADTENAAQAAGASHRSSNEVAASFSAANSKFTGKRGASTAKSGGKSDGSVAAHTRRQGTKLGQVKKHQRKLK